MAIEKQVPIVPITLPYNWIVLPDESGLLFHRHPIKAVIHKPILTVGMTLEDMPRLKQMTFEVIDNELKKYITDPVIVNESRERVKS
jgi:1-acyl-sn-glycerol-3-phosphate acyltransferase